MVDHNDVVAMRYVQVIVPSACLTLESTKEVVDETNTVSERRDRNALVVTVRPNPGSAMSEPAPATAKGARAMHATAAWRRVRSLIGII
jgi:hypothetical protein